MPSRNKKTSKRAAPSKKDGMAYVGKVLESIAYEAVKPEGDETVYLHRARSGKGVVEFVLFNKGRYEPHMHRHADSKLFVLSGTGKVFLNKRTIAYRPGDMFDVPRGTWHGFSIAERTVMLSIQSRPILDAGTGKIDIRYQD
jgi:quercetin dioxygenase-like cupin family protein